DELMNGGLEVALAVHQRGVGGDHGVAERFAVEPLAEGANDLVTARRIERLARRDGSELLRDGPRRYALCVLHDLLRANVSYDGIDSIDLEAADDRVVDDLRFGHTGIVEDALQRPVQLLRGQASDGR